MEKCKTCIHWKEDITKANWEIPGGVCTNRKLTEDLYEINSLVHPHNESDNLWTGPKFGCVHHKTKELKKPCPDCGRDWGHSYCGTCKGNGYIYI